MVLDQIYRQLFGKDHIQDGDVIELAEHGRQGGISSKQGFKFTSPVSNSIALGSNASLTFIGEAAPGTNATLPYWRISAFAKETGQLLFAEGTDDFDKVWESHQTYVYS